VEGAVLNLEVTNLSFRTETDIVRSMNHTADDEIMCKKAVMAELKLSSRNVL
jgi:hypothetical protein